MASRIPHSQFEVIGGAGHFLPPSKYAPVVLDFLAKHPLEYQVPDQHPQPAATNQS